MSLAVFLWLGALAACGDDDTPGGDAAIGDARDDTTVTGHEPAPPAPPEAPHMTPCPAGWHPAGEPAWAHCEPWPAGLPSCPSGQRRVAGDDACTPIDAPCGRGDFPDVSGDPVLYVRPGGGTGTGTRDAPFARLRDAAAVARSGATIALARGTYRESQIEIPGGVSIVGACAAETHVGGIIVTRPGVSLSRVTLGGEGRIGAQAMAGGELHVSRVHVEDATLAAFTAQGGSLVLEDVSIGRVVSPDSRALSYGVLALEGGTVELDRVWIDGPESGVNVSAGRFEARDLTVRGARPRSGAVSGSLGATLFLERTLIEGSHGQSLLTNGAPVTSSWLLVRDGDPAAMGVGNTDIVVSEADATLDHVAVIDGSGGAIDFIEDLDATLEDFVIHDRPDLTIDALGGPSPDLVVQLGARLAARRGRLVGGATIGVLTIEVTATRFSDLFVGGRTDDVAMGLATSESELVLERMHVDEAGAAGIAAINGSIDASDLTITRTRGPAGDGIAIGLEGTTFNARRVSIEECVESAILLAKQVTATFEDLLIRHVDSELSTGAFGRGIGVQHGSSLRLTRAVIEDVRDVGLFAQGEPGTMVVGRDVYIDRVRANECADTTCRDEPGGVGVGVYGEASVDLEGFRIASAPLCGAQIADLATLRLSQGEVSGNAIGVCLQRDELSIEALMDGVRYENNQQSLVATRLPVPPTQVRDVEPAAPPAP